MISESTHSGKDQLESGLMLLCQWKYGGVLLAFIVAVFSFIIYVLSRCLYQMDFEETVLVVTASVTRDAQYIGAISTRVEFILYIIML